MTDFKAGDKVRVKRHDNLDTTDPDLNWEIIFVGEHLAVVQSLHANGSTREFSRTLDILRDRWEVVPELFEAGKRYRSKSIHDTAPDFTVLYADEEIAFARYYATGKHSAHVYLYQSTRNTHEEA